MESHLPHELLLANQAFLQRLARSLVSDPAAAEDLVQDTALAALRRPPRATGSARAWLARVMRNLAASRARGESRRRAREADVARPEGDELGERLAAHLDVQRRVVDAVARLDEPYRTAILLRYVHDLSAAQIAERLGAPLATVRTRLARALERLRRDLDARDEPGSPAWSLVLLAGVTDVRPQAAIAATAAGGAIVAAKLVWTGAAVAVAALAGGWWMLREPRPAQPEGVASVERPERTIAPTGAEPADFGSAHELVQDLRAEVPGSTIPLQDATPPPDWSLELALRGWNASDSGTMKIEVSQTDSKEPPMVREAALAERIVLDVGLILSAPEGRPDRLTLYIDHPAFLPVHLGVLVPQGLLEADVVRGRLEAAVDLEHTSAVLRGTVELADSVVHARARVAAFRLDEGAPAEKPIDVAPLDATGRYRLRVGNAPAWIVVAWLLPERGASRARPASLRLDGPLQGEIELDPLVLDPGAIVEGRVVAPGGAAPPAGSIRIDARTYAKPLDDGLAWNERDFVLQPDDQAWRTDGSFRFEGLAPGPFRLQMASLATRERGIPKLQVQDSRSAAVDVTAPAHDLLVPFERFQVLVEVLGADGPVARARVQANWNTENGSRGAGTKADELGRVLLELGTSDSIELEGSDPEAGQGRRSIAAVDLVPDQVLDLRLMPLEQARGTLRVRLTGGATEIPEDGGMNAFLYDLEQIPPPMMSIWLSSVPFTTATGSASINPQGPAVTMRFGDGVWTIEGLPRSRILLRLLPTNVRREGDWLALGAEFEVDLTEKTEVELEWEARLGGRLRLDLSALSELKSARLTRPEGGSLELSYVLSAVGGPGFSVLSLVEAPGLYDIQPTLEEGAYRLEVTLRDGARRELPVQIVAGQITDLIVRPDDL